MGVNVYVNMQEALSNMDNGNLLVGNNLEWAREAVMSSKSINLNRYIEGTFLLDVLNELHNIAESYGANDPAKHNCAVGIKESISYIARAIYDKTGNTDFSVLNRREK